MGLSVFVQFAAATILPAIVTLLLEELRRGAAREVGPMQWQVICGLAFGLVAVFGTEFGIAFQGATMNVRDAAPIVAGLFFGGPAGIIAGVIGGVERWFSVLWGRGAFTRVACSVATCAAGFYAALLRKYVFEDRKPGWALAGAAGITIEVLHLMLVFATHPGNPSQAFVVVRACTIPMVGCNALAVALAALVSAWKAGVFPRKQAEVPEISQVVQSRLLSVIIIGFALSMAFTLALQGGIARAQTRTLLDTALEDVQTDISNASNENLADITRHIAFGLSDLHTVTQEKIDELVDEYDVSEINVVDSNGIIIASNNSDFIGFDMASGEQSREFLALLPGGGKSQFIQDYQPIAYDETQWRKYAGLRIGDGFVQVGYDAESFMDDLRGLVGNSVRNRHVGQDGALLVVAPDGSVAGTRSGFHPGADDVSALRELAASYPEGSVFSSEVMGLWYNAAYCLVEGYQIFALQPASEARVASEASALVMAFMEVIVFAMLFVAVFLLIRNEVVRSIWQVNGTLGQIAQGDLQAEVDVKNNAEFISLSHDINVMVASLREAIAAEATRIDRELEYARSIQESALPRTFPPFPEVNAFDIYALMDAAREVGGDFYDFFLVDDHTLGFLVADVSGKGIPASLFMMAAKTELANFMASGMSLAEAVQTANWHLCQGNDADMFVTAWAATLDYESGLLTYVNAGHNPPLLRHGGTWEWLRAKGGLFLGTFETARYRSATLVLEPGDQLLLYTDGVNEAFSAHDEKYGDERLERFLTAHATLHPRPLVNALRADLARWASGAEQSDDITMLALEYGVAPQATGSITVPATLDQLDVLLDFVHEALHGRSCPLSTQKQLDVVLEELFVNVCNYAYADKDEPGTATLEYVFNANPNTLTMSLSDYGVPFDPIGHADPEAPGSIAEAKIGGLGILMVKRMTDDLSYVRDDDKNVVAFVKGW